LRWSEDVLAEWIYETRRRKPDVTDQALGGVRRNLEQAFPYAMVTGYDLASTPSLPDPYDRHVLAAALHAEVDMLVTDDRRGFPEDAVQGKLDVYTADEFLVWVADNHASLLRPVLNRQVAYFRKNATPPAEQIVKPGRIVLQRTRSRWTPHEPPTPQPLDSTPADATRQSGRRLRTRQTTARPHIASRFSGDCLPFARKTRCHSPPSELLELLAVGLPTKGAPVVVPRDPFPGPTFGLGAPQVGLTSHEGSSAHVPPPGSSPLGSDSTIGLLLA
jgi:hypothetical protein